MNGLASDDIQQAANSMLISQSIVGSTLVFVCFTINGHIDIKSVLFGVILSILPAQLGLQMANFKVKTLGVFNPKSLAVTNITTKWAYTALLFISVIHFSSVSYTEMLLAYVVTTLAHLITPALN
ncbi:ATP synthase subunit I [Photobacterium rosenbergii]|uniref:ATP synthase subunit I n=1 Tax=Photobacterium rosenbergii TaxID=294936 RepID=UPI001C98F448|nr:ATP synthase subunit I [Photobacterium rosenbergii]MBY5947790.1 ATP synthase subunit I [Photobacterium rosenbergii]